tara:strand:+ start:307 stop:516 length:210 start_codon:yes stop_codon:yes gene_type:complete
VPSTVANALGEARVVVLEKPVAVDIKVRDLAPVERCERVLKVVKCPCTGAFPSVVSTTLGTQLISFPSM